MLLCLCLALGLGLGATPATAQPKQGQKLALLVGVQKYAHPKLPDLRFCENDVTALAELLRKAGYKVTVLCDSLGKNDPTLVPIKANIDKELMKLLTQCKDRHDTVVLGFAGHGLQIKDDKEDHGAFFCPSDAKPFVEDMKTLVSMKQIYKDLERSMAGFKVLLVDACRNSASAAGGIWWSCAGGRASRHGSTSRPTTTRPSWAWSPRVWVWRSCPGWRWSRCARGAWPWWRCGRRCSARWSL